MIVVNQTFCLWCGWPSLTMNCGGPGSGVPGPCASNIPKSPTKDDLTPANLAATLDSKSAAYGGRKGTTSELKKTFHQTSDEAAFKILSEGFRPSAMISKDLADVYLQDTNDGGDYVYLGMSAEASRDSAVSSGTLFKLDVVPYRDRAVVQPDQEGGIVMVRGHLSQHSIVSVESKNPKVLAAWKKVQASRRGS